MDRRKKIIVFSTLTILSMGIIYFAITQIYRVTPELSEKDARIVAEQGCIKGEESLGLGSSYNPDTKTWWFDVDLNNIPEGCSPACVVLEDTGTAEINWRCTGLISPEESAIKTVGALFAEKYPEYANTLSVRIDKFADNYARGGITFRPGAPGGIFLAMKIDDRWHIVHEGNGQIPCLLSEYGFPQEMIEDCSD